MVVLNPSPQTCSRFPDKDYDYSRSTRENYTQEDPEFTGPFAQIRRGLDVSFHGCYTPARQRLQDKIILECVKVPWNSSQKRMVPRPRVVQSSISAYSNGRPYIIFTAGAMGAGKSHVIKWMRRSGRLAVDQCICIDPDSFRVRLPEWKDYIASNGSEAGCLTHDESGYLVELAMQVALYSGRNIWVDGSLRDSQWFQAVFQRIRNEHPQYRIAIIHVFADPDTVFTRARIRAELTGRQVPEASIWDSLERVPKSVEVLTKFCDIVLHVDNSSDEEPQLVKFILPEYLSLPLSASSGMQVNAIWALWVSLSGMCEATPPWLMPDFMPVSAL